jgi:hypothetical protein
MRRRLLNFLTALSLLLCVAAVAFGARTIGHWEFGHWSGPHHHLNFYSWSGVVGLTGTVGDALLEGADDRWYHHRGVNPGYTMAAGPVRPGPGRWGFGLHLNRTTGPLWRVGNWVIVSIFLPWWFVVAVTAALPARWLWRRREQRRRRRRSLCPACGYDVRATPGQCPECGMVTTASPAA